MLDVDVDRVRFPDGSEGELEILRHPGAVAVLPLRVQEPETGTPPRLVLLRQYRYAASGRLWEVPAGKLEAGEASAACALRELEEEAGLRATHVRRLTTIHTTPGFTDEVIHLFLATGLEDGTARHEATEFIEVREVAAEEAVAWVRDGRISDAKTICAILYGVTFCPELRGRVAPGPNEGAGRDGV